MGSFVTQVLILSRQPWFEMIHVGQQESASLIGLRHKVSILVPKGPDEPCSAYRTTQEGMVQWRRRF